MLCVCIADVMDVVFSLCIVRRGAVGPVYGKCDCCSTTSIGCSENQATSVQTVELHHKI